MATPAIKSQIATPVHQFNIPKLPESIQGLYAQTEPDFLAYQHLSDIRVRIAYPDEKNSRIYTFSQSTGFTIGTYTHGSLETRAIDFEAIPTRVQDAFDFFSMAAARNDLENMHDVIERQPASALRTQQLQVLKDRLAETQDWDTGNTPNDVFFMMYGHNNVLISQVNGTYVSFSADKSETSRLKRHEVIEDVYHDAQTSSGLEAFQSDEDTYLDDENLDAELGPDTSFTYDKKMPDGSTEEVSMSIHPDLYKQLAAENVLPDGTPDVEKIRSLVIKDAESATVINAD